MAAFAHGQTATGIPKASGILTPQDFTLEVVSSVPAKYPREAYLKNIRGAVSVSVVISPTGDVMRAEASDGPPLLQAAAIDAAKQFKFKARKGSEHVPTKCWAELDFDFNAVNQADTGGDFGSVAGKLSHSEEFPRSLRVSEAVMRAKALRKVEPLYPRSTTRQKLHGTVVLDLNIQRDGTVRDVAVLSGPPELAGPISAAVRQWEFQPYQFLGESIDVESRFNFNVSLTTGQTVQGTDEDLKTVLWLATPANVKRGVLLKRVSAVYPQPAKQKGIRGPVLVAIVIGKDGSIRWENVIRGDGALKRAAIDAVKQWRYAPSTLNGQPVEVHDIVNVDFQDQTSP